MANLIKFWTNTKSKYNQIATKEPSTVYFCSDTHEIFKGDVSYSGSVKIVESLPTIIRKDTLYIITEGDKAGGYVYPSNGDAWKQVINGSIFTSDAILSLEDIPTASATTDGLLSREDKIMYDLSALKVEKFEESYPVTIESKDSTSYAKVYTFKQGEEVIGEIDIPKNVVLKTGVLMDIEENTVMQDGVYLPAGKYLVLTFANDAEDKVYINVGDLIDTYSAGDGIQIDGHEISLRVDTENGLTMMDGILGFDSSNIDLSETKIEVETSEGVIEKMLEDAIGELYASSIWQTM